jgi:mono/diheme cytochrome c family protein
MKKIAIAAVVALLAAEQVWVFAPVVKGWIFPPITHAAVEGHQIAMRMGCFSCHGPEGLGGFTNPGSDNDVVPALSGGEMMMWADTEQQVREWILYGNPLDEDHMFERVGYAAGQGTDRAVVMPAYEDYLSDGELELLIEYLRAISGLQFPEDDLTQKGMELAHDLGCFRCHGPMGTGGVANPGALKGYVPGFFGEDYAELVLDETELRQWLNDGITERFRDNIAASATIAGQALKMPAYGEFLDEGEIDSLVALVEWLNSEDWKQMRFP